MMVLWRHSLASIPVPKLPGPRPDRRPADGCRLGQDQGRKIPGRETGVPIVLPTIVLPSKRPGVAPASSSALAGTGWVTVRGHSVGPAAVIRSLIPARFFCPTQKVTDTGPVQRPVKRSNS